MKYALYLAIFPLLTINFIESMEVDEQVSSLIVPVKSTMTKYPLKGDIRRIHSITCDRIILQNRKEWTLLNPENPQDSQIIKHQAIDGLQHVAIHPAKDICAISHRKIISLYSILTGDIISEATFPENSPDIMNSTFSPRDNILFVRHEESDLLTKYAYKKNNTTRAHMSKEILNIACHPTQDQIALYTEKELVLLNTNFDIQKTIQLLQIPNVCTECKYNLDGSSIVIGHKERINLIDPETNAISVINNPNGQEDFFENFIFYPNNNTLVTVSQTTGRINFWNVKTTELLATLLTGIKNGYGKKIILNCDEKGLIITLKNKVFNVPVSFNMLKSINNQ